MADPKTSAVLAAMVITPLPEGQDIETLKLCPPAINNLISDCLKANENLSKAVSEQSAEPNVTAKKMGRGR